MSRVKGFLVVALAAIFVFAQASCGGGGTTATEFDSQELNDNSTQIQGDVTSAELIFAGTITALGTPPNFWSGVAWSTQSVTYTVDSVLKGTYTDSDITVYHLVVDGSRQAADTPGLSSTIFAVDNKLIVFAMENSEYIILTDYEIPRYMDFDEEYGTIPYSQTNEDVIENMINSAAMTLGVGDEEVYDISETAWVFRDLTVSGSVADVTAFNNLVNECKELSDDLSTLVTTIQNSDTVVTVNVVRNADNVFVDSFNGRNVDLDDIEGWPPGCNSKTEKCQLIGHILQEYWHASSTGDGYGPSHASALEMENKIRNDMNKTTTCGNHTGVRSGDDLFMSTTYNGTTELVQITGGNKPTHGDVTVVVTPPAAPTGLSADNTTSCQITISWTDNSNNEGGFEIHRRAGTDGPWYEDYSAAANATSFTNTPLDPPLSPNGMLFGETYCYRVRAWRGDPRVYSAWSEIACAEKR